MADDFKLSFNPANLLQKIFRQPDVVRADVVTDRTPLGPGDEQRLMRYGFSMQDLGSLVAKETLVNFERTALYREIDRALLYPLMSAAMELYADVSTNFSQLHNSTVWVTGEGKHANEVTKLFERINVEERIFDWAYSTGSFGDLFAIIHAHPGLGILSVEDDDHPINISRIDYNGRLVGFFDTPFGQAKAERELRPPWSMVHFRLLGAKRKRPMFNDPLYSEFRTVSMIDPDTRHITARYGSSLLGNGLPTYKRLRMAEDSLLIARLSKGPLHYVYKVKVEGDNAQAIDAIMQNYENLLKRSKAIDTQRGEAGGQANYENVYAALPNAEDVFLPVWGDAKNDLVIDKMGGETDIKWIKDVDALRSQLACALRVPLQLLGGFTSELPGSLGRSAIETLDIRFARSARRLQRAVIEGLYRIAQIHLSYMGLSPDTRHFEIHMAETSTAEEEELKDALDRGVDIVDRMYEMTIKFLGEEIDKKALLNYLNQKILKLNDFNINDFIEQKPTVSKEGLPLETAPPDAGELPAEARQYANALLDTISEHKNGKQNGGPMKGKHRDGSSQSSDLKAYTYYQKGLWEKRFKDRKVMVTDSRESEGGSDVNS